MFKTLFAAVLAGGLIAAPLPVLTPIAAAQTQPAAPETKTAKAEETADRRATGRARAAEEMRRRMEGGQDRRHVGEGNNLAKILERLQQAPQGGG